MALLFDLSSLIVGSKLSFTEMALYIIIGARPAVHLLFFDSPCTAEFLKTSRSRDVMKDSIWLSGG